MRTGVCLFLMVATSVISQTKDDKELFDMSLEELLNIDISVATKTRLKSSEAPNIVTVITREEIRRTGAGDLMDVLKMVSDFDFGVDVQGVVGLGIRGLFAHEGKVLLLWDGMELNEVMFSTIQFGNHYPVEPIERIEIIRGPGSALYGGNAELAVINIITRTDMNGLTLSGSYGQTSKAFSRRNFSASYGRSSGDWLWNIHTVIGEGRRSTGTYEDFFGNSYSMRTASDLNPRWVQAGLSGHNIQAKFLLDEYRTTQRDEFDEILSAPVKASFSSYIGDLQYTWQITPKMKLMPRLNVKYQKPWDEPYVTAVDNYKYDRTVTRYLGQLLWMVDVNDQIQILSGVEYLRDEAKADQTLFLRERDHLHFYNSALFSQFIYKHSIATTTAGIRWDYHNEFGSAVAPRIGFTKTFDRWSFKALASGAFRSPGVENIDGNRFAMDLGIGGISPIKPERTFTLELEAGYALTADQRLTFTAHQVRVDDPIVYFYEEAGDTVVQGYRNFERVETRGFGLTYRLQKPWGYAQFGYSFYSVSQNRTAAYQVPGHDHVLLGFAPHKCSGTASFRVSKALSITPSFITLGSRYGYFPENGSGALKKSKTETVVNLFLNYGLSFYNLELSVGINDIFDERPPLIQPYNNGHAPLPGPAREWMFRVSCDIQ